MNKQIFISGIMLVLMISAAFAESNLIMTNKQVIATSAGEIKAVLTIKNAGSTTDIQTGVEIQPRMSTFSTVSPQGVCDPNYPKNVHVIIQELASGESTTITLTTPPLQPGSYNVYGVSVNQCCPGGSCYAKGPFGWETFLETVTVVSGQASVCGNDVCEGDENPEICSEDCQGYCGDAFCSSAENIDNCYTDCIPVTCDTENEEVCIGLKRFVCNSQVWSHLGTCGSTEYCEQGQGTTSCKSLNAPQGSPEFKIEILDKEKWNRGEWYSTGLTGKIQVDVRVTNRGDDGTMFVETGIWKDELLNSWNFQAFSTVSGGNIVPNCVPQQTNVQTKEITLNTGQQVTTTFELEIPAVSDVWKVKTDMLDLASQSFKNCAVTGLVVGASGADRTNIGVQAEQFSEPEASCSNGFKDGDETDIDCGGPTCPQCRVNEDAGGDSRYCVTGCVRTSRCEPAENCIAQDTIIKSCSDCGSVCTVNECHRIGCYVSKDDVSFGWINPFISSSNCLTAIPTGKQCDGSADLSCSTGNCEQIKQERGGIAGFFGGDEKVYVCADRKEAGFDIIGFLTDNILWVVIIIGGLYFFRMIPKKKRFKTRRRR